MPCVNPPVPPQPPLPLPFSVPPLPAPPVVSDPSLCCQDLAIPLPDIPVAFPPGTLGPGLAAAIATALDTGITTVVNYVKLIPTSCPKASTPDA